MRKSIFAAAFAAALACFFQPFIATPASAQVIETIATGLGDIGGIGTDGAGNVYVSDKTTWKLYRIPSNGDGTYGAPDLILNQVNGRPCRIAVDADGTVYVAGNVTPVGNEFTAFFQVMRYSPPNYNASGTSFYFSEGASCGIALDSTRHVYFSNATNNTIVKIDLDNFFNQTTIYTGNPGDSLQGVQVDANGHIFVAAPGASVIKELDQDGTFLNSIATAGTTGTIALDTNGHLYFDDSDTLVLAAAPDFARVFGSGGFSSVRSVAVDSGDNVFVGAANGSIGRVRALPMITGVSPNAGPEAGAAIGLTVTGKHFGNPMDVSDIRIGTELPSSFPFSDTQFTIYPLPAGTGAQHIRITTGGVTSPDVPQDVFTYAPVPTLTGISPTEGGGAGGTSVVITGTGFTAGSVVRFGAVTASSTFDSASQITATSPGNGLGVVDVTVITPGGTTATSSADQFTYLNPAITSVSPTQGPIAGGNTIVLTGTRLDNVTGVTMGGCDASASITANTATSVSFTATACSPYTPDIAVATAEGSATVSGAYTYIKFPHVTGIAPVAGPASGGTVVIVTGTFLDVSPTVKFGSTTASITVDGATQITATAPAHAAGDVNVTVTTPGGTSAETNTFTYVPAPVVTTISPSAGPIGGNTQVTITGTNLTGASAVMVGGSAATNISVVNATTVTAKTPAHVVGAVTVEVTTLGGTGSKASAFTYAALPTVTSVSPAVGPIAGNTTVTITGTNLTGASAVKFSSAAATSVHVVNATTVTAKTPAHGAGAATVAVTTPGGTGSKSAAFSYYGMPTITAINPNQGPANGGTSVAIVGTDLTGVTGVKFGTTAATSFSASSSTRATATAPAHAVGAVNVALTTPGGTSVVGGVNKFTYTPTPALTTIAKFSGGSKDGAKPVGGLVADSSGNLYGTTSQGGKNNLGTIFRLVPSGGSYTKAVLFHFDAAHGATPFAGLVVDSSKNLYGVTTAGGNKNKGVVFKYTNSTKKLSVLYNFQGTTADGGVPYATLARDSAGLLYGATTEGGSKGKGTTFTFKEPSTFKVTHHFTGGADGDNPQGAMLLDANKNVYGTTIEGGAPMNGTAYKIAPNGTRTILRTFSASSADSHAPRGGLFMVGSMLFGTASTGGTSNKGTIFEIMPPSTGAPILFNFTGTSTGANPYAGVVGDSATILYGTTFSGGNKNRGTVFKLLPPANGQTAWSQSVMASFQGGTGEGASPAAPVLLRSNRTLYGTTNGGGSTACAGGCGTVFKVTY